MSWATIATKNTKPIKTLVKEEPVVIKPAVINNNQLSPYDVFDEHYGDKIYQNIVSFTNSNNGNVLTRRCGSSKLYGFFLNYVDIHHYSEPIIEQSTNSNVEENYDEYDYY